MGPSRGPDLQSDRMGATSLRGGGPRKAILYRTSGRPAWRLGFESGPEAATPFLDQGSRKSDTVRG